MPTLSPPRLPLTGGCQCGAVRYSLNSLPVVFYACHCTECQKQSSSAFGESFRVRRKDLTVTGTLATFERPSASGPLTGEFCTQCGTRLFHRRGKYSETLNIKAGSLDDASWLHPAGHIWTKSKQPWVILPEDALTYDRQPEDNDAALIAKWQEMLSPKGAGDATGEQRPLRKQYHFRPSPNGYYAWDVHRLIELAKDLPIISIDTEDISELTESYWFGGENANPTCMDLLEHVRLIEQTDLRFPIILCADGRMMDGMHRVVRAVLENRKRIDAVRFPATPDPDYVDVQASDLPYD